MGNTQERIKQRHRYLKKKGIAYTKMSMTALLVVLCAALAILVVFMLPLASLLSGLPFYATALVMSGLSFYFGIAAFRCADSARIARREAKQLHYVPPVAADTLPAEELLVRGSEEPIQMQRKVLLRCTDDSAGMEAQELLRGSQKLDE